MRSGRAHGDAEVRSTALLSLGNAAHRLGSDGASIVEGLLRGCSSEESHAKVLVCLQALGNSGDARIVPAPTLWLEGPDADVRAAALWALRFVPTPEAGAILTDALAGDAEATVRAEAVSAMAFRSLPALLPALGQALRVDPDAVVRKATAALLAKKRRGVPGCDNLLRWSAENDANDAVQRLAKRALAQRW